MCKIAWEQHSGNCKVSLDPKSIGGQGRLTANRIDKLQVYYGLAIQHNKEDLEGMKNEVWAGMYHSASMDENPQHQFCPNDEQTWCKYHRSVMDGKDYHHSNPLPLAIVKVVKPVYDRLTKPAILDGCLGGYSQNNCEALKVLRV